MILQGIIIGLILAAVVAACVGYTILSVNLMTSHNTVSQVFGWAMIIILFGALFLAAGMSIAAGMQ